MRILTDVITMILFNLCMYKCVPQLSHVQAHVALATPRYPSYRPYGVPPPRMAEACPINLHTMVMEVGPSSRSPSSPTPCNDVEQG